MNEHTLDTLSECFKAYHELWLVNVKLKEAVKIFEVYFLIINLEPFHMLTVNLEITTQRKRCLKSIWSSENIY